MTQQILPRLYMYLPNTVTRIDRIGMTHNFTVHEMIPGPKPIYIGRQLTASDAFVFTVSCESGVSLTLCDNVKRGLVSAGNRISQILRITTPITVSVKFGKQSNPYVLGGAMYGSAFFIKKNERYYTMAQALVKQLKKDVTVTYSPIDIIAEFNSDVNWYFRSNTLMRSSQTDFEYVICHELTHGLGFGTGFLDYSSVFTGVTKKYLAPLMIGVLSPSATTETLYQKLEPIDIYDSFIKPLDDIGARIAKFPLQNSKLEPFVRAFESSGDPFVAATQAYTHSTSSLRFQSGNLSVNLYTPSTFEQGSSISHVRLSQAQTADFLMIPQLAPGVNMDRLMVNSSVYGPDTMAIMEAIGWPRNGTNTTVESITLAMNYGTLPSSAIRFKPMWVLTLLLTLFLC